MSNPLRPGESGRAQFVTVEIFNQTYHLSGHDAAYIRALADRVDAMMRAVSAQTRTADSLRVAVLTAVNLADELMRLEKRRGPEIEPASDRAANLNDMLDELLTEEHKAS